MNRNKIIITIAIFVFLLVNPVTKPIILFLLPLGYGIDDLIAVLLVFAGIFYCLFRNHFKVKIAIILVLAFNIIKYFKNRGDN